MTNNGEPRGVRPQPTRLLPFAEPSTSKTRWLPPKATTNGGHSPPYRRIPRSPPTRGHALHRGLIKKRPRDIKSGANKKPPLDSQTAWAEAHPTSLRRIAGILCEERDQTRPILPWHAISYLSQQELIMVAGYSVFLVFRRDCSSWSALNNPLSIEVS